MRTETDEHSEDDYSRAEDYKKEQASPGTYRTCYKVKNEGFPLPPELYFNRDSNSIGSKAALENYFSCQEAVAPYEIIVRKVHSS